MALVIYRSVRSLILKNDWLQAMGATIHYTFDGIASVRVNTSSAGEENVTKTEDVSID